VQESFQAFFDKHVLHYRDFLHLPVHFTGGISLHFSNILQRVCIKNGLKFGIVSEKPVSGLLLYHSTEENL
jgi:hypothetical protein